MVKRATWFGDRAVLVHVASASERESIAASLAHRMPEALVRRGMESVLIERPTPEPWLLDVVQGNLRHIDATAAGQHESAEVRIAVDYNGTDLGETAKFFHIETSELITAHTSQAWRVAMMGFAPGFGYLEPLEDPLLPWASLPRRDNPRARVPAGSVAVAAGMSAVYPTPSPGGWHLLGTTTIELFDSADDVNPTLLRPGVRVRFFAQVGGETP